MPVSFEHLTVGTTYSRPELASMWGYSAYHALARGVVTPQSDNKIILFVTADKQPGAERYVDRLEGNILFWEGPTDHFAEERMIQAATSGDEIHLFYRQTHHSDFTYYGQIAMRGVQQFADCPSRFTFQIASL